MWEKIKKYIKWIGITLAIIAVIVFIWWVRGKKDLYRREIQENTARREENRERYDHAATQHERYVDTLNRLYEIRESLNK